MSCHDIAGIWVAFFQECQRYRADRYRQLGIVGQLPAFQGNVPAPLKRILNNPNMTENGQGTAWMDSLDPIFGKIADAWMQQLIADFGTDHWYQMDGYFNGGTAPWMSASAQDPSPVAADVALHAFAAGSCTFGEPINNSFIPSACTEDHSCPTFKSLAGAESACAGDESCSGITLTAAGYELREGSGSGKTQPSKNKGKRSWLITNAGTADCRAWKSRKYGPDPVSLPRPSLHPHVAELHNRVFFCRRGCAEALRLTPGSIGPILMPSGPSRASRSPSGQGARRAASYTASSRPSLATSSSLLI